MGDERGPPLAGRPSLCRFWFPVTMHERPSTGREIEVRAEREGCRDVVELGIDASGPGGTSISAPCCFPPPGPLATVEHEPPIIAQTGVHRVAASAMSARAASGRRWRLVRRRPSYSAELPWANQGLCDRTACPGVDCRRARSAQRRYPAKPRGKDLARAPESACFGAGSQFRWSVVPVGAAILDSASVSSSPLTGPRISRSPGFSWYCSADRPPGSCRAWMPRLPCRTLFGPCRPRWPAVQRAQRARLCRYRQRRSTP